jgi:uncharacterized RDD family membrane protein YckC
MGFAESAPFSAPEAPTSIQPAAPTRTQPAGFWIRLGASLIDSIAVGLIGIVPFVVASGTAAPGIIVALGVLLLLFMYLGYAPVMLALNNGATWGKQACERRVVINDGSPIGFGRALVRELVVKGLMGLLILPYWASAIMVGVRRDKRGLHDLIAGTRVVGDVPEL